jgi:hypothetical protein
MLSYGNNKACPGGQLDPSKGFPLSVQEVKLDLKSAMRLKPYALPATDPTRLGDYHKMYGTIIMTKYNAALHKLKTLIMSDTLTTQTIYSSKDTYNTKQAIIQNNFHKAQPQIKHTQHKTKPATNSHLSLALYKIATHKQYQYM